MLEREIRNYVRVVLAIQRANGSSIDQAKHEADLLLGDPPPSEDEFKWGLNAPARRKRKGRQRSEGLTKRDAVAAVAVYFESLGAGVEQAINEAKGWLRIELSRRVAKNAITAFKALTTPEDFRKQADWAYTTFRQDTTLKLPHSMTKTPKKRQKNLI
jgi:hypothetical protein